MLHYYFFKYWSRGIVGLMVSIVVGYFGIFSYSLIAAQRAQDKVAMESAQLSITPPQGEVKLVDQTYQKSLKVFEGIQDLKVKKQDTTKLETMYADSVKNLSNQNPKEAATQLQELESQIAKINSALAAPTPEPSGIVSGTPSISPAPSGSDKPATPSGELHATDAQ
jgi:hypothetical protein